MNNEEYIVKGSIHTASYWIHDKLLPALAYQEAFSHFGEGVKHDTYGTNFRFNPNKGFLQPNQSLQAYFNNLMDGMKSMGRKDLPELIRLDFKIDFSGDEAQTTKWVKLAEYSVFCFAAMKHIREKNGSITHSLTQPTHQSTKAETDGFGIKVYNKALQKHFEGVGYRFELTRKPRNVPSRELGEIFSLMELEELLHRLPDYMHAAEGIANQRLFLEWQRDMPSNRRRSIPEFLRSHTELIFFRKQLKALLLLLGKTEHQADVQVKNFLKRTPGAVFCTADELKAFCESAAEAISNYVGESDC